MGQNGAGKSTLIKVLTGVYPPDAGEIALDGAARSRRRRRCDAQRLGISTVYQEVNLCPNLSVAENIFAGRYPRKRAGGAVAHRLAAHERATRARCSRGLNLDIDVDAAAVELFGRRAADGGDRARARASSARVLILDEPTSSLDEHEVAQPVRVLRRLRDEGMAILFVTHFLDQVYAISDRITVLRNGERVGEYLDAELPPAALITAMVGRDAARGRAGARRARARRPPTGAAVLRGARPRPARRSCSRSTSSCSRGEVVGLGGLLGSGRTELARLLFGLDRADSGELAIDGAAGARSTTRRRRSAHGLGVVPRRPQDRRHRRRAVGAREHRARAAGAHGALRRAVGARADARSPSASCSTLGIKAADLDTPIALLSGGNQQKARARALARDRAAAADPRRADARHRRRGQAGDHERDPARSRATGMAVLFISSEMEEVVRVVRPHRRACATAARSASCRAAARSRRCTT